MKFSAIYESRIFITVFTRAYSRTVPCTIAVYPVRIMSPDVFKIRFNVVLSSTFHLY
jgi:hypothetical protein